MQQRLFHTEVHIPSQFGLTICSALSRRDESDHRIVMPCVGRLLPGRGRSLSANAITP